MKRHPTASILSSVRSAAQTTYGDDVFPPAIVVTYPPHPLVGTTLKVVGHRHQGKEMLWRAILPDGSRVDLPAVWTDRSRGTPRSIQPRGKELRTTPLVLRELTALLETLVAASLSCKARTKTLCAGANDGNPAGAVRNQPDNVGRTGVAVDADSRMSGDPRAPGPDGESGDRRQATGRRRQGGE